MLISIYWIIGFMVKIITLIYDRNFRASDNRPKSFQVSLRASVLCVNIKFILRIVFNLRISDVQNQNLYGYIPYQIGELSQLTEL